MGELLVSGSKRRGKGVFGGPVIPSQEVFGCLEIIMVTVTIHKHTNY